MTLYEHFENNGLSGYLTKEKAEKLEALCGLLLEYNKKVNLTSIRDRDGVYAKHFADCASVIPYLEDGAKMLDIGCGGGFPSLPAAILRDDLNVTSMDSTAKKLRFVELAAKELGLKNVKILCGRAEELCAAPLRESFDAVTARAVAALPILCEICLPYVKRGGVFIAMKTDASELQASSFAAKLLGADEWQANESRLICGDEVAERCIICFKKTVHTPQNYPRRYSQIRSGPLNNENNRTEKQ